MSKKVFAKGKWICSKEFADIKPIDVFHKQNEKINIETPDELKNLHMLVKKTFEHNKSNTEIIKITADDYYKLYINGKLVGQGPAQGYYFNYYWNEYNVSDFLVDGINEIFVDVYYQGLINRAYNSGDRRMGVIAELYSEGNVVVCTDETWLYAISNSYTSKRVTGYNCVFLEDFDSRWKPTVWYSCVSKENDYTFNREATKPLQISIKKPIYNERLSSGGLFYDFGTILAGSLIVKAKGKSGSIVKIFSGEEMDDSPLKVRYAMRSNCYCEEYWTLDDGVCEYRQYDYKGFRYATIIPSDTVEILSVDVQVRHYPFDDDYCNLKTDNKILKSVWNICKNAVKYGSQEVYVDCLTREKGQYAGDMTVTSASQVILTGDTSLLKKAIENQMQSSFICKGLMAVTPGSEMQEIADYSLQFPILALRYYRYTKDKDFLQKTLKCSEGVLEYFNQFARKDGLLENVVGKWNLVDWPDNLRDNYAFKLENPLETGCHNVINAFYIGCMLCVEKIRGILGLGSKYNTSKLIDAFNNEFFDVNTKLYRDCANSEHCSIHSNILPAFYGFNKPESKEKIHNLILNRGMCCGVYMSYFLLKALCRMGYYEDAYGFIVSTDEHSWYNMVCEGATTCFEAWGKEQKWNTSLCHPWASAPIPVLVEDIIPNMSNIGRIIYKVEGIKNE